MDKEGGNKILWAPWRIEYITDTTQNEGCVFCERIAGETDRKNLIVYRGETAFVIMNKYPYNNGHLLIVPYQHTSDMGALKDSERLELFQLLERSQAVLSKTMHPQGFNIGMNVGRLAGAGIVEHLHFHVVPRWGGDTNFMPIVGHTKVISEALEKTCERLAEAFERQSES